MQALVRRLSALEGMRQMERNRLAAGVSAGAVLDSITAHLATSRPRWRAPEGSSATTSTATRGSAGGATSCSLITGIGERTAAQLLAELLDIKLYRSAKQVAAFAGLAPSHRDSGSSVRGRPRLSKVGTPRLRKALYFPAISAIRHNPAVRELSARLQARGKCPMLIIGAAMRKLVHIA